MVPLTDNQDIDRKNDECRHEPDTDLRGGERERSDLERGWTLTFRIIGSSDLEKHHARKHGEIKQGQTTGQPLEYR